MRLPPVDKYRAPFVEPIGHLAMQTAYAETELIGLCSGIPYEGSSQQMSPGAAAHLLRNWTADAEQFVAERIGLIAVPDLQEAARDAVARYAALRGHRHRAIHDAVEVGIIGDNEAGYLVQPLATEYRRENKSTSVWLNKTSPEMISELACLMHEVQRDLNWITGALRDRGRPENVG